MGEKHTPGPWAWRYDEGVFKIRCTRPGAKYKIADVIGWPEGSAIDDSQPRANAALIADAPRLKYLLAELVRLVQVYTDNTQPLAASPGCECQRCRDAQDIINLMQDAREALKEVECG